MTISGQAERLLAAGTADDRNQIARGVLPDGCVVRYVESVGGKDDDAQGDAQQDVGDVGQVGLGDVGPTRRRRRSDSSGLLPSCATEC
jgi:hypothetical protein